MAEKKNDEELTLEELRLGRTIINAIYLFGVALVLAVTLGVAVAGYLAWPWFVAIPLGAALIFGARVFKRYFRNILDGVSREIDVQSEYRRPVRPANDFVANVLRLSGGSVIAVAAIMCVIAAFWYLIGVSVRWLPTLFN